MRNYEFTVNYMSPKQDGIHHYIVGNVINLETKLHCTTLRCLVAQLCLTLWDPRDCNIWHLKFMHNCHGYMVLLSETACLPTWFYHYSIIPESSFTCTPTAKSSTKSDWQHLLNRARISSVLSSADAIPSPWPPSALPKVTVMVS